ncbi:MAG: cobinamide adenolsyltransferase [Thermoleophilia bacterium]|nr:cobinamide adenolsyltransferase [Thermoleophilia bacterium]
MNWAIQQVVRAAAYGRRTCVISFLEAAQLDGELQFMREYMPMVDHRCPNDALTAARTALQSGEYHMVVLEDVETAVALGFVSRTAVEEAVASKAPHVEVVVTGAGAPSARSQLIKNARKRPSDLSSSRRGMRQTTV